MDLGQIEERKVEVEEGVRKERKKGLRTMARLELIICPGEGTTYGSPAMEALKWSSKSF